MRGNWQLKNAMEVIYPLAEVLNLYCALLFIVHSSTENILGKGSWPFQLSCTLCTIFLQPCLHNNKSEHTVLTVTPSLFVE